MIKFLIIVLLVGVFLGMFIGICLSMNKISKYEETIKKLKTKAIKFTKDK